MADSSFTESRHSTLFHENIHCLFKHLLIFIYLISTSCDIVIIRKKEETYKFSLSENDQ